MRVAIMLLVAATMASSCSEPAAPDNPGMTGLIVARDLHTSIGGPPTIHVKESGAEECGVVFVVRPATRIVRRTLAGRTVSGSLADLAVGRRVAVHSNVVLMSCPGQSAATAIEVLDSPA